MTLAKENGEKIVLKKDKNAFLVVEHYSASGEISSRENYREEELLVIMSLLDTMRSSQMASAYLLDDFAVKNLQESYSMDYAEKFTVFPWMEEREK